jgi:hypothetical protein
MNALVFALGIAAEMVCSPLNPQRGLEPKKPLQRIARPVGERPKKVKHATHKKT